MIEGTDFAFLENIEPSEEAEKINIDSAFKGGYASYSEAELREMLDRALAEENYEKAARIRDELSKRQ